MGCLSGDGATTDTLSSRGIPSRRPSLGFQRWGVVSQPVYGSRDKDRGSPSHDYARVAQKVATSRIQSVGIVGPRRMRVAEDSRPKQRGEISKTADVSAKKRLLF